MNPTQLNVALYLRVSSDQQAAQGTSIPAQRRELEAFVARNGWHVVTEYVDEAESARSADRPRFQEMIADATSGAKPFEAILVYDLSRFARNRLDSGMYKLQLRKQGVAVISYSQQIGNDPEGQLLEGVIESVDQYYSDRLRVVTLRGQKEVSRRGYRVGGSAPFGYQAVKQRDGAVERTVLRPDPFSGPIVAQMFAMRAQGVTTRDIAMWLNSRGIRAPRRPTWVHTTVAQILENEVYIGTLTFNQRSYKGFGGKVRDNPKSEWVILPGAHEPLVTEDLFGQASRFRVKRGPRRRRYVYHLTGVARCGRCGGPVVADTSTNRHNPNEPFHYYVCAAARRKRGCRERGVLCDVVDRSVIRALRDNPIDYDKAWESAKHHDSDPLIERERAVLVDLERRLSTIEMNMEGSVVTDGVKARALELQDQVRLQAARVKNMEAGRSANLPKTHAEMVHSLNLLLTYLRAADRVQLRAALQAIIAEVSIDFTGRRAHAAIRLPIEFQPERVADSGGCGGVI